ncbi:hypothetical protein [Streptomyces sp. NPDC056723]|uniref:hypothetical protein n=1 Tax=Streptomyces sp. NPDC056723 TaxID=3345925 RepID=UPI0036D0E7DE
MNTFQIIQLAMTIVFAVSACVVAVQVQRCARIAQDAANRAEAAARSVNLNDRKEQA